MRPSDSASDETRSPTKRSNRRLSKSLFLRDTRRIFVTDGVERLTIDGVPVAITGVSRTPVDCFKRRNDVGLDVALEALRDARRLRKLNVNEVWRIAERRRTLTFMRPYLEAIA